MIQGKTGGVGDKAYLEPSSSNITVRDMDFRHAGEQVSKVLVFITVVRGD